MLKAYSDEVADTVHPALPIADLTLQIFLFFFSPKCIILKSTFCVLVVKTQVFTTIYVTLHFLFLRFIWNIKF